MKRAAWLLLLCLAVLPFGGCNNGGECDRCTEDTDCKQGFVCSNFPADNSKRCASGVGATTCRVR
jgi:hypothetical protein